MNKINLSLIALCGVSLLSVSSLQAKEIAVKQEQNTTLNIYSNNLALVNDVRKVSLPEGENQLMFEGVSRQMRPESALFQAKDVSIIEQNYKYDLLDNQNLNEAYIGKEVKTAVENPKTGEVVYDKAILLNYINGMPILQFDYGVETKFPGRLIFEQIPENLQVKPSLEAKLTNKKAGEKDVSLTYLTNGLSWKADYVAEIINEDTLNLNTWISLNNDTGVDFSNAKIQVIAGDVNQSAPAYVNVVRPMLARSAKMEMAMDSAAGVSASVPANRFADYYTYSLPEKTTLKNNQSKQIKLLNLDNVKYEKEYVFNSPLYLRYGVRQGNFEKLNPEITFKFENLKKNNLGVPLPSGILRFYDKSKQQNNLFIGENSLKSIAVGEKFDLSVGRAFDIFAQGKITQVKMLAKDIYEYGVEVKFRNSTDENKQLIFKQNIYDVWEVLQENIASEKKNASQLVWKIDVPKNAEKTLTFRVRINRN